MTCNVYNVSKLNPCKSNPIISKLNWRKIGCSFNINKCKARDPGTVALVPVAPLEAQVQVPKRRNKRLKLIPEYINQYIVSKRPRSNGRIDKYYQHKELNLNFRSLAEVERYESRGIYPRCAMKRKENEYTIRLHEPLLTLTYEETEQLNVEEPDASTKEIINDENIENVDTYNSPKTGMRIPKEQCYMIEPCNNIYMPNHATASAPKETTGYIIEATHVSTLPPKAQAPTPRRRYNNLKPLSKFLNNWIVIESPRKNGRIGKKYCHKEHNITLRSLLEVKRYETDDILPVHGKKKKESNNQSESPTPLLYFLRVIQPWFFLHLASRRGRKRKMKTVVSSETEANIGVEQNDEATPIGVLINDEVAPIDVPIIDEAALIDIPINDETAPIDVPIIDEAALIDVPITYVNNFSDLGR
ncbi:hypothetical protein GOBAR_DD11002 [Gossypium barbadense]|nr:hypothetical protein GOBAR_DD11002 [Gossypium barbadense]